MKVNALYLSSFTALALQSASICCAAKVCSLSRSLSFIGSQLPSIAQRHFLREKLFFSEKLSLTDVNTTSHVNSDTS